MTYSGLRLYVSSLAFVVVLGAGLPSCARSGESSVSLRALRSTGLSTVFELMSEGNAWASPSSLPPSP